MDQIKLIGSKLNNWKDNKYFTGWIVDIEILNLFIFHISGTFNSFKKAYAISYIYGLKSLTDITRKLLIIWRCCLHTLCKILKWWRKLLLWSMKLRTCKFWKNFKIIAANADGHIHGYILECVDITIDNSMHPKKMEWRWYGLILRYQCQTDLWGYRCFSNILLLGIIRILRIFSLCIWQTLHDLKHK